MRTINVETLKGLKNKYTIPLDIEEVQNILDDGIVQDEDFSIELKGMNHITKEYKNVTTINKERDYRMLQNSDYLKVSLTEGDYEVHDDFLEVRRKINAFNDFIEYVEERLNYYYNSDGNKYTKVKHIYGGEVVLGNIDERYPEYKIEMYYKSISNRSQKVEDINHNISIPNVYTSGNRLCLGSGGMLSQLNALANDNKANTPQAYRMAYQMFFNNSLNNDLTRFFKFTRANFGVIIEHIVGVMESKENMEDPQVIEIVNNMRDASEYLKRSEGGMVLVSTSVLLLISTYTEEDVLLYIVL